MILQNANARGFALEVGVVAGMNPDLEAEDVAEEGECLFDVRNVHEGSDANEGHAELSSARNSLAPHDESVVPTKEVSDALLEQTAIGPPSTTVSGAFHHPQLGLARIKFGEICGVVRQDVGVLLVSDDQHGRLRCGNGVGGIGGAEVDGVSLARIEKGE